MKENPSRAISTRKLVQEIPDERIYQLSYRSDTCSDIIFHPQVSVTV